VLAEYLRESGLEKPLMEREVVASWGTLMGDTVARLTRKVELNDGVLVVRLSSAALKAQLFECRRDLVHKMNEHVGCEVVKEVRLLG
jgi:predicted nucleic acid-binding Zn ribbon protein